MLLEKITGFSSSQYLEITYFSSFSLTILNCVASFPYVKNLRHIYATFCWYSTSILDHWSFCQLCFISKFELLHQNGKEKIKSFWHVVMKKFITFLDQLLVFSGFFFLPHSLGYMMGSPYPELPLSWVKVRSIPSLTYESKRLYQLK